MDDSDRREAGDSLEIEVSTLQPPGDARDGERKSSAPVPLKWHLSPTQRVARAMEALSVLLLGVLILILVFPALPTTAGDIVFGPSTPTIPIALGQDTFYVLPNVPWGTVSVDGHPLVPLPLPGDPHPLHLKRGAHQFTWHAEPFQPISCTVSVPPDPHDTCATQLTLGPNPGRVGIDLATLVTEHDSLRNLPLQQGLALRAAVRAAVEGAISSTGVKPGEHYFYYTDDNLGAPVAATQPLLATLGFRPLFEGWSEPCVPAGATQPCRYRGQDCRELCTEPGRADASVWTVAVPVHSAWTYTTLDGRIVASGLGEFNGNLALMALRITWDGTAWHVATALGHATGIASADDLVCAPARGWIAQGTLAYLITDANLPIAAQPALRYLSDATPIDGCAVALTDYFLPGMSSSISTPPALFLKRFGVLLAVNDVAHRLWPALPRADTNERALALRLLANP
jgi:hypothetical protein